MAWWLNLRFGMLRRAHAFYIYWSNGSRRRRRQLQRRVFNEASDATISWSLRNDSFVILDTAKFSHQLLLKYFEHNNFSSFMHQLKYLRFQKNWYRSLGICKWRIHQRPAPLIPTFACPCMASHHLTHASFFKPTTHSIIYAIIPSTALIYQNGQILLGRWVILICRYCQ